jgi:hypothetical protein
MYYYYNYYYMLMVKKLIKHPWINIFFFVICALCLLSYYAYFFVYCPLIVTICCAVSVIGHLVVD